MKKLSKLFVLCIFLCIPAFIYAIPPVIIWGEFNPIPNQTYSYSHTAGAIGISGTKAKWTVTGGKFLDGSTTFYQIVDINSVDVIWNDLYPNSGTLSFSYTNGSSGTYEGLISVTPKQIGGGSSGGDSSINYDIDYVLTSKNIAVSGKLATYNNINLSVSYTVREKYTVSIRSVDWTINNAGTIINSQNSSQLLHNPGSTQIKATVKYRMEHKGSATTKDGEFTLEKTITLADGTLDAPTAKINGRKLIGVGSSDYFTVSVGITHPYLKYEWRIFYGGKMTNLGNTSSIWYDFMNAGYYVLWCTVTNTKTGASSITDLPIDVSSSGAVQRVGLSGDSYIVINNANRLEISKMDNFESFAKEENNILYSIYNMLTGVLVDGGSTTNGSSIDTYKLPKGLYILKLNYGTNEETHKFTVR